jgi:hypothetical protein
MKSISFFSLALIAVLSIFSCQKNTITLDGSYTGKLTVNGVTTENAFITIAGAGLSYPSGNFFINVESETGEIATASVQSDLTYNVDATGSVTVKQTGLCVVSASSLYNDVTFKGIKD